jgi:hypothetical protein
LSGWEKDSRRGYSGRERGEGNRVMWEGQKEEARKGASVWGLICSDLCLYPACHSLQVENMLEKDGVRAHEQKGDWDS